MHVAFVENSFCISAESSLLANKEDSAEIQNEFSTNATCIDSKKYKSYKLI